MAWLKKLLIHPGLPLLARDSQVAAGPRGLVSARASSARGRAAFLGAFAHLRANCRARAAGWGTPWHPKGKGAHGNGSCRKGKHTCVYRGQLQLHAQELKPAMPAAARGAVVGRARLARGRALFLSGRATTAGPDPRPPQRTMCGFGHGRPRHSSSCPAAMAAPSCSGARHPWREEKCFRMALRSDKL